MNNPQNTIELLESKLSNASEDIERFYLLCEIGRTYKQMWKIIKALEACMKALEIAKALLMKSKEIEKDQKQNAVKIISLSSKPIANQQNVSS